ncbi:hypothetical protein DSM104299_03290 [Baekduia alba]|uniref:hypothetical protein n=1 Tax=Baekduia alba TaxID=2997333 RepID=UPI00234076DD|nr:hypothetical protein [Baekduia alba]WCB94553.1 hypothetical protein DSM104299_03290 [Baekduia alba]
MHKTLIALAALIASMAITSAASGATTPVRALKAHTVTASGIWAGQADARTVAFRAPWAPGATVLRADDGTVATAPAPSGCSATAAGGGRLAYWCGADDQAGAHHLAVTALTGAEVVRLDAPSRLEGQGEATQPKQVGAQWIVRRNDFMHEPERYEAVNWRTGATQTVIPSGEQILDPDLPGLLTPLCAPVHVISAVDEGDTGGPLVPVAARGRWVLQGSDSQNSVRPALYRCGSSKRVLLPDGFNHPVLGDGWVGQEDAVQDVPRVKLFRLADRRLFTVTGLPKLGVADNGPEPALTFTRDRVYVHATSQDAVDAPIATVQLPKH